MSVGFAKSPEPFRLTVKQFHRMIEAGVLTEDDPVELLEGCLVAKMPHNPPHDSSISRCNRVLSRELSDDWVLRVQSAVTMRDSEPEPDIAVAEGPEDKYDARHPFPADIGLLIEVADSSLEYDRTVKGRLYAKARIEVYWLVNLVAKVIEVYSEPKGGKNPQYGVRQDYHLGETIPLLLRGQKVVSLKVSDLFPAD